MAYVYRIEDSDGRGCYVNKNYDFIDYHNGSKYHPAPCRDEGIQRYCESDEYCAFKDLGQLQAWFTQVELNKLMDMGHKIVRKKAKITAYGRAQVLCKF